MGATVEATRDGIERHLIDHREKRLLRFVTCAVSMTERAR